jgi:hypothetical protein
VAATTRLPGAGGGTSELGTAIVQDTTAPTTKIRKGPKRRTKDRTPTFRFRSSEPGSTFRCAVARKKASKLHFKPCKSPDTLKRLRAGKYRFAVFAVDAAANRDETPAKRTFKIIRKHHRA